MCTAIIKEINNNEEFIIYNYILSIKETFTSYQVQAELKEKFSLNIELVNLINDLNYFVKIGLLKRNLNNYVLA